MAFIINIPEEKGRYTICQYLSYKQKKKKHGLNVETIFRIV